MCLGIPGQITQITNPEQKLALVDIGGVRRPVNIACIVDEEHPVDRCVGDWVLVHVGFAMNRIDEREAKLTLELLAEMAEVHEALEVP
ncbi:MAG: HypC/HybG/HupF family hydrogenase formation chaperone [Cyanobacteria bacterium SBLK]|nr:HypC/HybG/HupF family hydrogenase formation chaperone [Cyanobacteria bacterium SBLK]